MQRIRPLPQQSSVRCTNPGASSFQTPGILERRSICNVSVSKHSPPLRQGSLSRAEDAMAAFHVTKCSRTSGKLWKQHRYQSTQTSWPVTLMNLKASQRTYDFVL